jgi:hypothetical protein
MRTCFFTTPPYRSERDSVRALSTRSSAGHSFHERRTPSGRVEPRGEHPRDRSTGHRPLNLRDRCRPGRSWRSCNSSGHPCGRQSGIVSPSGAHHPASRMRTPLAIVVAMVTIYRGGGADRRRLRRLVGAARPSSACGGVGRCRPNATPSGPERIEPAGGRARWSGVIGGSPEAQDDLASALEFCGAPSWASFRLPAHTFRLPV